MKNQFRTTVFKRAYAIVKNTDCKFSEALKKSWSIYRLLRSMKKEPTTFVYKKKNGERRQAYGVIKPTIRKTDRKPNFGVVIYHDQQCGQYRSFRAENLLEVA